MSRNVRLNAQMRIQGAISPAFTAYQLKIIKLLSVDYFLKTLHISKQIVQNAIGASAYGVAYVDKRREANNKLDEQIINGVRDHINSFPRLESHYCRKDSVREYLEAGLTQAEMYRLYKIWCAERSLRAVSKIKYIQVFSEEFRIGFHHPKKDICDRCERFRHLAAAIEAGESLVLENEAHLLRKNQARDAKTIDKAESAGSATVTFDLQQLMVCPKINVGSAYYL